MPIFISITVNLPQSMLHGQSFIAHPPTGQGKTGPWRSCQVVRIRIQCYVKGAPRTAFTHDSSFIEKGLIRRGEVLVYVSIHGA